MVSDCGNKISVLKQILLGIWGRNMLIMSEKKNPDKNSQKNP